MDKNKHWNMQINNCPTDARVRKNKSNASNVISFLDPRKTYNIEKGIGFLDIFDLKRQKGFFVVDTSSKSPTFNSQLGFINSLGI